MLESLGSIVAALNQFQTDKEAEIITIRQVAIDAVVSNHWAHGGTGVVDLARAVERACDC
jgi:formyltetrahydrofolate synthetase